MLDSCCISARGDRKPLAGATASTAPLHVPTGFRMERRLTSAADRRPSTGSGTRRGKRLAHSKGDRPDFKLYFPASSRRDDDGPSFKAQPNLHAKIRRQQGSLKPAYPRTPLVDSGGSSFALWITGRLLVKGLISHSFLECGGCLSVFDCLHDRVKTDCNNRKRTSRITYLFYHVCHVLLNITCKKKKNKKESNRNCCNCQRSH